MNKQYKILITCSFFDPNTIVISTTDQVARNGHAVVMLFLCQDALCCVTHDKFRSSDRILWHVRTMDNSYSCCEVIYRLGHQYCNFFDLGFTSDCCRPTSSHNILKIVYPLYKTFVPRKLSTAAHVADSCLNIWKVSQIDFSNFSQNLKFARCSNSDILEFCRSHSIGLQKKGHTSAYSICTQVL